MNNIQFDYLFRDEDNYKEYGSVVFSNPNKLTIEFIEAHINNHLIEGTWFDPDQWSIPRFSFHQFKSFGVNELVWYEFEQVQYCQEAGSISIDVFLKGIEKSQVRY